MTTMIITIVLFMIMLLMGFPVAYAMGIAECGAFWTLVQCRMSWRRRNASLP